MAPILFLLGGALLIYYVNAKEPKDLNAFDRLLLSASAPLQDLMTRGYQKASEEFDTYLALVQVKEENLELRRQTELLSKRLQEFRELELENERLRRLLDFSRQQPLPFHTAKVVGYDPTSHFRTLRLDRGLKEGVRPGMAVATAQGVVGRILRCWTHYSDVLLLTAPHSGVDALIQRSRARGTVEGLGGEMLRLKYLLRLDEVQQGDLVITSGLDNVFPPGLLIGIVSGLRGESMGVFKEVQIAPAVDMSRVEEVIVLERLEGPPERIRALEYEEESPTPPEPLVPDFDYGEIGLPALPLEAPP